MRIIVVVGVVVVVDDDDDDDDDDNNNNNKGQYRNGVHIRECGQDRALLANSV
jgi:hypothetical protein